MISANEDFAPVTLDLRFLGQPGVIASFLLRGEDEAALIETGPGSSVPVLLEGLAQAGVTAEEVRHILVTHVHLDHAGGAGLLLHHFPNAVLYVHEVGAPHLIDPSRLVASATRIYGSLMDRLWGEILPVPSDRLIRLADRQRLRVAGRTLEVLYTPGHAKHHAAFRDLGTGTIFAGDVAGSRLEGCTYVRPLTPPPDLDLEEWDRSLDLLASFQPPALYLTHFGRHEGVAEHLDELRSHLRQWESLVLAALRAGQDRSAIAALLQRSGDEELLTRHADAETIARYESTSAYTMNVAGYERYLRRRHPNLPVPETSR
ncbi:MAG TPA: MBL fold metallo-hydrolase [Chloroflexota bacterium]|nr:MBL fold metallo-hydrolase [Chloroflexota bacterium]